MKQSILSLSVACLLWAFCIGLGMYFMMQHESTPGKPALPPVKLPKDTKMKFSSDKDTLVMFVHPQCPCTRASLEQLNSVKPMSTLAITVMTFNPTVKPKQWETKWDKSLFTKRQDITFLPDNDGLEARRFNAQTSGQTMLFDKYGSLLFSGGITSARGVSGESAGLDKLRLALTRQKPPDPHSQVVFGCSLTNTK